MLGNDGHPFKVILVVAVRRGRNLQVMSMNAYCFGDSSVRNTVCYGRHPLTMLPFLATLPFVQHLISSTGLMLVS